MKTTIRGFDDCGSENKRHWFGETVWKTVDGGGGAELSAVDTESKRQIGGRGVTRWLNEEGSVVKIEK